MSQHELACRVLERVLNMPDVQQHLDAVTRGMIGRDCKGEDDELFYTARRIAMTGLLTDTLQENLRAG